jgi:hypothetical protein
VHPPLPLMVGAPSPASHGGCTLPCPSWWVHPPLPLMVGAPSPASHGGCTLPCLSWWVHPPLPLMVGAPSPAPHGGCTLPCLSWWVHPPLPLPPRPIRSALSRVGETRRERRSPDSSPNTHAEGPSPSAVLHSVRLCCEHAHRCGRFPPPPAESLTQRSLTTDGCVGCRRMGISRDNRVEEIIGSLTADRADGAAYRARQQLSPVASPSFRRQASQRALGKCLGVLSDALSVLSGL